MEKVAYDKALKKTREKQAAESLKDAFDPLGSKKKKTPKPKKKNKGGRPSKIKTINLKELERVSGLGLTIEQLALYFKVNKDSIVEYQKKDVKFSVALKRGKILADSKVVESLYQRAIGYRTTYKKNYVVSDGKDCGAHIEQAEEELVFPPDATSMIYWLKNRDSANWRDKIEIEHGLNDELLDKYKDMQNEDLIRAANDIARAVLTASGNSKRPIKA